MTKKKKNETSGKIFKHIENKDKLDILLGYVFDYIKGNIPTCVTPSHSKLIKKLSFCVNNVLDTNSVKSQLF